MLQASYYGGPNWALFQCHTLTGGPQLGTAKVRGPIKISVETDLSQVLSHFLLSLSGGQAEVRGSMGWVST